MKNDYHKHLQQKLYEAYVNCLNNNKNQTKVILTKHELEDMLYLWKNEAPKIWKIDDTSNAQEESSE